MSLAKCGRETTELRFVRRATSAIQEIQPGLGPLARFRLLGDRHPAGTVARLTFSTGEVVIAKPRCAVGECIYYQVVEYIAEKTGCSFARPKILLDRKDISIFSQVETCTRKAIDEESYFGSMGAQLAVLFCLGATDISYENVMPTRSAPAVVDVETLFSPERIDLVNRSASWPFTLFYNSVQRTGLMPSNYIFSPVHTREQLASMKLVSPSIYSGLRRHPVTTRRSGYWIATRFLEAIGVLQSQAERIAAAVRRQQERIASLRLILRPTHAYLQYMKTGSTSSAFIQEELSQISRGVVPYFTYDSLGIVFSVDEAVRIFLRNLRFCVENSRYLERSIYRLLQ